MVVSRDAHTAPADTAPPAPDTAPTDTVQAAPGRPDLTVVIPVRNRADEIGVAIHSILATAGDAAIEVVVVDDGSTDDTADAVSRLGDRRVRVVRQAAAGVSVARNAGVDAAHALFVAFLDSDDVVLPGWVAAMCAAGRDGMDLYSCAEIDRDEAGCDAVVEPAPLGPAFGGLTGRFQAGAFGVSVAAFRRAGGYLPGLVHGENSALWLALGRANLAVPLRVDSTEAPLVVVHRRDRPYDAERYYTSGARTLLADGDMLRRDRVSYAHHLAVTGVAAMRSARRREAIRLLARAAAARPWPPVNIARLVRATLPVRRR